MSNVAGKELSSPDFCFAIQKREVPSAQIVSNLKDKRPNEQRTHRNVRYLPTVDERYPIVTSLGLPLSGFEGSVRSNGGAPGAGSFFPFGTTPPRFVRLPSNERRLPSRQAASRTVNANETLRPREGYRLIAFVKRPQEQLERPTFPFIAFCALVWIEDPLTQPHDSRSEAIGTRVPESFCACHHSRAAGRVRVYPILCDSSCRLLPLDVHLSSVTPW
jgi:hypothetical protein